MKRRLRRALAFTFFLCVLTPVFSQEITREQVLAERGRGVSGIPVLSRALTSDELIVRRTAVRVLAEIGEPAANVLTEALENPDGQVRRMALLSLHKMDRTTPGQLLEAATDESEAVRMAVVEMLDVLKMWNFLPDFEGRPLPDFEIHGETELVEGPHGLALDVPYFPFVRGEPGPERQGGEISNNPLLFPEGAFSVEIWASPSGDFDARLNQEMHSRATLLDVMGVSYIHQNPRVECRHGYKVYLLRYAGDRSAEGDGVKARIRVELGFGRDEDLSSYTTRLLTFYPGDWYRIVFIYDGEGKGEIYLDGERVAAEEHEGGKGMLAGRRSMGVGERASSTYEAFPGSVGPARIYHRVIDVK